MACEKCKGQGAVGACMHELAQTHSNLIFVFGSNEAGIHGGGAAKTALQEYGAKWGNGVGFQGRSYAIPTKDTRIETLPLEEIRPYVKQFMLYAKKHPEMTFFVTRIGCGLAGYTDKDIAPMFDGAPINCILPQGWDKIISRSHDRRKKKKE